MQTEMIFYIQYLEPYLRSLKLSGLGEFSD